MMNIVKDSNLLLNKEISYCETDKASAVSILNIKQGKTTSPDKCDKGIKLNNHKIKKALCDYVTVMLGGGFGRFIALLNAIIIARTLGPARYGLFSIFFTMMMYIWLLPQAFDTTFVRFAKKSSIEAKKDFLKAAFLSKIAYSAVLLFFSYPLSYFLADYCFHKPQLQTILIASIFCGIFIAFCTTVASVFQEREKFIMFTVLSGSYTFLVFLILLLFKVFRFSFSLNRVILVYLFATGSIGIFSFRVLYSRVGCGFPLDNKVLKKSLGLGQWIFGVTLIFFLFQRIDVLYLARSLDFNSIGVYSAAKQLTMVIAVMSGALAGVFLPKASEALLSKEAFREYLKNTVLVISIMIFGVVCLFIVTPAVVGILFGIEYIMTSSILRILLIGWLFFILYQPFSFLFYTLGDARIRFFLEFVKLIMVIALLNWLVPLYGMKGAAIAMSVSIAVTTCISLVVLKYKLNFYWGRQNVNVLYS